MPSCGSSFWWFFLLRVVSFHDFYDEFFVCLVPRGFLFFLFFSFFFNLHARVVSAKSVKSYFVLVLPMW